MRLNGRGGKAAAQRPMQIPPAIICPVCGLRNDITVRFCRNCGLPLGAPRDPVRGTTTKRAELPSDRGTGIAAIVGLLVVVAIVGVAGLLIYKGFQGNGGASAGTPGASFVARASLAPTTGPQVSFPAASVDPGTSLDPGASQPVSTGEPPSTVEPGATDTPSARPDKTPVAIGTLSAWTCKTGAIADPLDGRWRIAHVTWNSGASSDRLTLSLTRVSGTAKHGTTVTFAYTSPSKAASKLGVRRPVGDHAIVLTFDGPIAVGRPLVGSPGMRAVQSVDVRRDASGVTHAVIGVSGAGCARLNAADWKSGSDTTQTADLTLDVRR